MNFIIQTALKLILNWAYSLKPADFAKAFELVLRAEKELRTSTDKAQLVRNELAKYLGSKATGRVINFLLELAVARLGK